MLLLSNFLSLALVLVSELLALVSYAKPKRGCELEGLSQTGRS